MPLFSFSSLITPSTRAQMLESLLSIANTIGLTVTAWQSGQPVRTVLTTVSQKLSDLTQVAVEITRGGFGDLLSSDEWADQWAYSGYNVERVVAEPATTDSYELTNASATQYDLDPGELIVAHNVTGKTYRNTQAISILANDTTVIEIAADEVGTASNAAPGAIETLVTTYDGVTGTNPEACLGADKEATPALVTRARAKFSSLSPAGPKNAYDYVARSPDLSPTSTPITRTNTVADPTTGEVSTYLATATGSPSGGDVAIVQTAFDEKVEPWCTKSTAVASADLTIPVTYTAWVSGTNLTQAQLETIFATALAAYFAALPIGGVIVDAGGTVYKDSLSQVIGQATPGVVRVTISAPAADVSVNPNEVPVLGTVTPTVNIL